MSVPSFRDYLYPPDHPRVAQIRGLDARGYAEAAKTDPFAGPMIQGWAAQYPEPFTGVTSDGVRRDGLYPLEPAPAGEEAPAAAMTAAARDLLARPHPGPGRTAPLRGGRARMAELGQPGIPAA